MTHFIDTIKLADGNYKLLSYHNRRINNTIRHFFGDGLGLDIKALMPVADKYKTGIYKCRLVYSKYIENIKIIPYVKRVITRLKVVDSDNAYLPPECKPLHYEFKYKDRICIKFFLKGLSDATDILITRNGFITDTSFSNIILLDGKKWVTPNTYLMNGVKRRYLLDRGDIEEKKILIGDLQHFQKISLINAMLNPEDIEMDTCNII